MTDDKERTDGLDYTSERGAAKADGSASKAVDIDALARAVICSDYGSGEERRRLLGSDYTTVQRRVNEMLS